MDDQVIKNRVGGEGQAPGEVEITGAGAGAPEGALVFNGNSVESDAEERRPVFDAGTEEDGEITFG